MKNNYKLAKIPLIVIILTLFISINIPSAVFAAGETVTGALTLTPTIENIGVICGFSGDDGDNNALLEYREAGGVWKTAPQMWKDTRTNPTIDKNGNTIPNPYANTYRGSIFWLTTNTQYEVRVTFTDPDGVSGTNPVVGTVTTWNDNPPSTGTAYYVATNGNDANAGTEAAPFRTIAKGASVATAGSIVYVKAGTYNEQISMSLKSGAADNYITFRPYGTDSVTIDGGFTLDRCSYIRIKGFTIRKSDSVIYVYNTLYPASPGSNPRQIIIEDNTIIASGSNQGQCVRIAYGAGEVIVQRNTLTVDVPTAVGDKSSIWVWNTDGHNIYRNNLMNGKPYDGIGGGPENELGHMSNMDVYNNIITGAVDDGIQIEGDNVNSRIYNNIISGGSFCGIATAPLILGPVYTFRNLLYGFQYRDTYGNAQGFKLGDGSTGRSYIYHNTIYSTPNGGDGFLATNAGLGNIVSRNNVLESTRYAIEFGHSADANPSFPHDLDYDVLWSTDSGRFVKWTQTQYNTLAQFQSISQEEHGWQFNPVNEFSNIAGGDFTLVPGSQLIDQGVVLPGFNDANSPWPYSGSAPDIGAFEYNDGAPPVNHAPTAVNDSYSATVDTALVTPAPGVLVNDTDSDGDPLTAQKVSDPAHGTVTLNSDGSFTYTPASGYNGADSFTYRANDGQANSNTVTVTITISAPNNPPVAVNDTYTTNEDTATNQSAPGVLGNDTDADGNPLTAIKVSDPAHGTVTLNSNGSFTYTPAANYNGADSFTYRANDGQANSGTVTVNITVTAVNDAPVATNNSYTTNEDTAINQSAPGVLSNDTDADGNPLTAIKVSDPAHGTVTLNSNGSFTYTPAANYNGADSFTYRANDGQADSGIATVNITVTAFNNPPVAVNDAYTTNEDTAINQSAPGVLANDTDADGNPLTAVKVSDPAHGTVTLNSNGSFTYTPAANYNGADSFTYRANDGQANSGTVTVNITVTAVNDAPVATNNSYTTNEDTAINQSAPGVLSNDTDADGNPLTAIKVSDPAHGTVTLNSNGSFTYTPAANYNGSDSFTYRANDGQVNSGTVTVNITITAVNDAPVAVGNSYTATENTPLNIAAPGALGNDTDVEGSALTAWIVANPSHGTVTLNTNGSFIYTPTSGYTGADSFTYRARDGQLYSNTVTVSVTVNSAPNSPPLAAGDSYTATANTPLVVPAPGVLGNDSDSDGDTLTAVKLTDPAHGTVTLNGNGSFTYTPASGYTGADSFTYRASDGQANSSPVTVTLTINAAANNPPSVAADSYTTTINSAINQGVPGVLGNDNDADGDTLSAVKVGDPAHGNLTLNSDGSFTYVPASGYTGPDSFTYQANDGQVSSEVVVVNVTIESSPPNPPSGGGGGGGFGSLGGSSGGSSGGSTASLRNSVTSTGELVEEVSVTDIDLKVEVRIPKSTVVKNRYGETPSFIRITPKGEDQAADANSSKISQSYEIDPSGTTFERYAILIFKYGKFEVPADIPLENLYIALWDPVAGVWTDLGGELNTQAKTISVQIEHLSVYSLMAHSEPANFESTGFSLSRNEVSPGEQVTVSVTVNNKGDLAGINKVVLEVDNVTVDTRQVTLAGGESETVSFVITSNDVGYHNIDVGSLTSLLTITKPAAPAALDISEFKVTPLAVEPGETVTGDVRITNTGDLAGTYRLTLIIDNIPLETREGVVAGGMTGSVTFTFTPTTPGSHKVTIGNITVPFEVVVPAPVVFTPEIIEYSVSPSYEEGTGSLAYNRIAYRMSKDWDSYLGHKFILNVLHEGQLLEQIPLLTPAQRQSDGLTGYLDYAPAAGWQPGEYAFKAELFEGDLMVEDTPLDRLTVTSQSLAAVVSWKTLGIIIGASLAAGLLIIGLVLYFRRRTLRDYWK